MGEDCVAWKQPSAAACCSWELLPQCVDQVSPQYLASTHVGMSLHGDDASRRRHPPTSPCQDELGTIRRGASEHETNCFTPTPPSVFNIRGPTYLKDGVKIPAQSSAFKLERCEMFSSNEKVHAAVQSDGEAVLTSLRTDSPGSRFLVINFVCPIDPHVNLVLYFSQPAAPCELSGTFESLLDQFLTEPSTEKSIKWRNSRFKLIAQCKVGPWVVRQLMGTPVLIGKKIQTDYHVHKDYLEVSIDIGSSTIARAVLGKVASCAEDLVIDLGFVIEAKDEHQLPEQLLGGVRLQHVETRNIESKLSLAMPMDGRQGAFQRAMHRGPSREEAHSVTRSRVQNREASCCGLCGC